MRSRHYMVILVVSFFLAGAGPVVHAQEDSSNLEDFDIDSEDFTLDGGRTPANMAPKSDAGPAVDNYSSQSSDADGKLDLGNENFDAKPTPSPVPSPAAKSAAPPASAQPAPAPVPAATPIPAPAPQSTPLPIAPKTSAPVSSPAEPSPAASASPAGDYDAPPGATDVPVADPSAAVEPAATLPFIPENEFAGTPYVPGGRQVMALGEAPEYYKIEAGDTLFDICDQLIDDADYWPKLWALNPGIKNPHFIFPGMILSFYPGDDTTPPYLQVVTEEDIIPLETGGLTEQDLLAVEIEQVPYDQPFLEISNVVFDIREIDKNNLASEFEEIGAVYPPDISSIEIPAFIFDDSVDEKALALGGPKGEIQVIENDQLLIDDDDGNLQVGSLYTVVRENNGALAKTADSSYRYENIAHIKILGMLDDGDVKVATVVKSRLGINPGDMVIDYRSTKRSFSINADRSASDDEASMVIGFDLPSQTMGGQGDLIFIEGQHSPGSIYNVYQNTKTRLPQLLRTTVPEMTSRIAAVKVIDSVGSASLAVVLRNEIDIRLDDRLSAK